VKLKYGKKEVLLPIQDKNIIKILYVKKHNAILNPENSLKNLLKNPIGSPSLKDLIIQKKPKRF